MTGDQRFFLAFAQSWRTKTRDKALRRQIATDGHAPGSYRALTVRNLDDWYKAFDVQPGQKLYLAPDKRVHEIGRAHVLTPVTNAHIVCRLLLEKKKTQTSCSTYAKTSI